MKSLIAAALTISALVGTTAPLAAASLGFDSTPAFDFLLGDTEVDRRGRSKPRVPGGSGCDTPRDLIQHPECTVTGG